MYKYFLFAINLILSVVFIPNVEAQQVRPLDPVYDANFVVLLKNGSQYCVNPQVGRDGKTYAYEAYLSSSFDCIGQSWRYDAYGHIGYSRSDPTASGAINSTYMCMTDQATASTTSYKYIVLMPCSMNNKNQIWRYDTVSQRMINRGTGNYLQEINWYLATSKNSADLNHLKVTGNRVMLSQISKPYTTAYNLDLHYSDGKNSYTLIRDKDGLYFNGKLRYDPVSKQISSPEADGRKICMTSAQVGTDLDSAFILLRPCSDSYASGVVPRNQQWNISPFVGKGADGKMEFQYVITDADKNYFGIEILNSLVLGTAFTARKDKFIVIQKYYKSTIVFKDGGQVAGRMNFKSASYTGQQSAQQCPAKGVYPNVITLAQPRVANPPVPGAVNLEVWLDRLYQIATETRPEQHSSTIGVCGACLLQTLEVLYEFMHYGVQPPALETSPHFFAAGTGNAINSFEQRFPALTAELENDSESIIVGMYGPAGSAIDLALGAQYLNSRAIRHFLSRDGLSFAPEPYYNDQRVITDVQLQDIVTRGINAPNGSIFVLVYNVMYNGVEEGHAVPLIRTSTGLHLIPSTMAVNSSSRQYFNTWSRRVIQTPQDLRSLMILDNPQVYGVIRQASLFSVQTPDISTQVEFGFDSGMLTLGNCSVGGAAGTQSGSDTDFGGGIFLEFPSDLMKCLGGRCGMSDK